MKAAITDIDLSYYQIDSNSPSYLSYAKRKGARCGIGTKAGTLNNYGYWKVNQNKRKIGVHRIVYCLSRGLTLEDIKDCLIDHIDGDKSNNNPLNLRTTDHTGNMNNMKCHRVKVYGEQLCFDFMNDQ